MAAGGKRTLNMQPNSDSLDMVAKTKHSTLKKTEITGILPELKPQRSELENITVIYEV